MKIINLFKKKYSEYELDNWKNVKDHKPNFYNKWYNKRYCIKMFNLYFYVEFSKYPGISICLVNPFVEMRILFMDIIIHKTYLI